MPPRQPFPRVSVHGQLRPQAVCSCSFSVCLSLLWLLVASRRKPAWTLSVAASEKGESLFHLVIRVGNPGLLSRGAPLVYVPGFACYGSSVFPGFRGLCGWLVARARAHLAMIRGHAHHSPQGQKDLRLSLFTLSKTQLTFIIIIILGLGIKRPIKMRA